MVVCDRHRNKLSDPYDYQIATISVMVVIVAIIHVDQPHFTETMHYKYVWPGFHDRNLKYEVSQILKTLRWLDTLRKLS